MRAVLRLLMLMVLLATGLVLAPAAGAQRVTAAVCSGSEGYPFNPNATIQISATVADIGATVEVSGTHYCPGEKITITVDGTVVGSAETDSTGVFDPPIVVPGPAGDKTVCAKGTSDLTANNDCLTLTAQKSSAAVPAPNGGGGTAFTGVRIALLTALALLLVAGGVAFLTAGRTSKTSAVG